MGTSKIPSSSRSSISKEPSSPQSNQSQSPLTEEQSQILKEFRSELVSEGHLPDNETLGTDDETLIRFLRARKFNLVQAKRMITQCLQWRHQVEGIGIDELYRELDPFNFPQQQHVFKHWPMYYHRMDKLGRPINIQRFGSLDLNKLYSQIDKGAHFRSIIVNCEALTREILPACTYQKLLNVNSGLDDRPDPDSVPVEYPNGFVKITNAFCIVDLKGFTLGQFWQIKTIARLCFSISQDYYPETMGYLAIINAPNSFATIFKAIQPWLSKDTIAKINILGEDYTTTLLEHIEPENLPDYLGGQCPCDPNHLGHCQQNDPDFDRSPWLRNRDWKSQSWNKFRIGAQDASVTLRDQSKVRDEVRIESGMTQDGALIINTHKTSSSSPTPSSSDSATVVIDRNETSPESLKLPVPVSRCSENTIDGSETSTGTMVTAKSELTLPSQTASMVIT